MFEWSHEGPIGILRLAHGKASALDLELLEGLQAAFREAEKFDALVVTGTGRIFSAGVDLFRLTNDGAEDAATYVDRFLPALDAALTVILRFQRPVVAAVNGHAIAGGCLVALACDHKVMVPSGARIGVPELQVGVPFPSLAAAILDSSVAPNVARRLALSGVTVEGEEALSLGLVDATTTAEELLSAAVRAANDLRAIRPETFAVTKAMRNEEIIALGRSREEILGGEILRIWKSPEAHGTIREYLAKTVGKK